MDYEGYNSEVEWGCGCAGADNCEECENDADASGCNADKSQEFECYNSITTPGTLRTSPGKPLPKLHLVTSAPNPLSNVTGKFPESNTYIM